MTMSAQPCANAGISKTYAGTRIAETPTIQGAHHVTHRRKAKMMINSMFKQIFQTDMDLITDDVSQIQRQINAEHNVRNIGTARCSDHIVPTHDAVMRQALAPRQYLP